MTEEELIVAIGKRAANVETRTDYANIRPREIAPPATTASIRDAEQKLGFLIYPLLRRLLQDVGNGGYGPGDGLIGIAGEALDVEGRSLTELRQTLWPNEQCNVVPLSDWGDGIWTCLDNATGAVLTMSEFGLMDTGLDLQSWLEQWVSGANLWNQIVVVEDARIQNPRTKEWIMVPIVRGVKGTPYRAAPQR